MNKAIAFDLDGTLIDVSQRDYQIYSDLVIKLGGTPLSYSVYWPLRQAKTDIHQILEESGINRKDKIETFLVDRKALMESAEYLTIDKLFPVTLNLLDRLSEEFEVHIITIRHDQKNTRAQLSFLELDRFNCHIVQGNKEEQMRLIPNLCYMVGDTENDILPANNAGVKSIAVTTGIRNKELLSEMNPTFMVSSLSGLLEIVYDNV